MTKEEKRLLKRIVFGLHQEILFLARLMTDSGAEQEIVDNFFQKTWEYMNVDADTEDRTIPVGETGKEDV